MPALFSPFKTVDSDAGLNLNHHKCYWIQYGNDSCQDLLDWVSQAVRIGPEGHLHRWTVPPEKVHPSDIRKSMKLPKVWSSGLLIFKSTRYRCLGISDPYPRQMKPRSRKNPMRCKVPRLVHTMPCPQIFYEAGIRMRARQ